MVQAKLVMVTRGSGVSGKEVILVTGRVGKFGCSSIIVAILALVINQVLDKPIFESDRKDMNLGQ